METVYHPPSQETVILVHRMYLQGAVGAHAAGACANPGSAMIDNVEVEIGGQRIDRHYGHWLENWAELTEPNVNREAMSQGSDDAASGPGTLFQRMSGMGGVFGVAAAANTVALYVPLQFWFCRNPLVLLYHSLLSSTTKSKLT